MIRDLTTLPEGTYIADFRYDEGFRVRDDGVCPCLSTPTGGGSFADDFSNRGYG